MNFLLLLFLSTIKNLDNLFAKNNLLNSSQLEKRYDNYVLLSIDFKNQSQRLNFERFTNNYKTLDIWRNGVTTSHVMVGPEKLMNLKNMLNTKQFHYKTLIPNIQSLIDREKFKTQQSFSMNFDWSRYHTLEEINSWLNFITKTHPKVTSSITIGESYEGRKIQGIKISYKSGNPGIFVESNIHAREWITSATATWIINELLTSKQIEIRYLAENYDWFIIPVLNVDGFVYSHQRDRLWRKNRHPNPRNKSCFGVDVNRNYNIHWKQNDGASSDPCDETYAGPYPFSEPETRSLAKYLLSVKKSINLFLAFHSYGQMVLSPYGYTNATKPRNYDDLMSIANAFSEAVVSLPSRTKYRFGATSEILYIASGDTSDWAYAQGIRLSYTIEFRDKGQYGFLLPSEYIVPNSKEVLSGIFSMITEADFLGYINNSAK